MSTRDWFVEHRGVRSGPLPRSSVEGLRARGLLADDTPVWREGMPGWRPWREAWESAYGPDACVALDQPPRPPPVPVPSGGGHRPPPPVPIARHAGSAPTVVADPALPAQHAELPRRAPWTVVGDYLRRHWRGEFSLPWAYWINGTLLGFPIALLLVGISAAASGTRHPGLMLALVTACLLLIVATGAWQLVGIWRSSDAYVRARGSPVWSGLAKAMCLLGLAQLALATGRSAQELAIVWRYGEAVGEYADYAVEPAEGGRTVVVRGPIGVGFGAAVVEALDAHPQAGRLRITSEGGLVHEALVAAEAIAARGMEVEVAVECSSACFALFAAGRRRIVNDGAVLLLHAIEPVVAEADASDAGRDEVDGETQAYERLLVRHGIPDSVVDRWRALDDGAAEAAPLADLLAAGTIDAVRVDDDEVPGVDFFPIALERLVADNPGLAPTVQYLRAAQRSFPVVFREAMLRYRRMVRDEPAPKGDAESAADYLARVFGDLASDGASLGAWRAIVQARLAEMQRLSAAGDIAACHAIDHGTDDAATAARIAPSMHAEVARWTVALAEADDAPAPTADALAYRDALQDQLVSKAAGPWVDDFAREGSAALARPEVGCGFAIAWYREVLALPEAELNLLSRKLD